MLIDTHCHIDMIIKNGELSNKTALFFQKAYSVVDAAKKAGVSKIITIGVDSSTNALGIALATEFPEVWCTVGVHPCDLTLSWKKDIENLKEFLKNKEKNRIVGIGETGLDFYHKGFDIERQKDGFKAQIELALEYELPLVIHTRNSIDETLAIVQEYQKDMIKGVFHCFSHDYTIAQECIKRGFMLGIGGIITYPKNDYLRTVVQRDQLEHCVLETDAPFLPPQTIRGQKNSPTQIKTIAAYCAELLGITPDHVAQKTTDNAHRIFTSMLKKD